MRTTRMRRASAVALAVLVGALAGCGSGDEETTTSESTPEATQTQAPAPAAESGGEELEVTAVEGADELGWDPTELTAGAGPVTINMDNPDGNEMPHAVAIEGSGVEESGETVPGGQTSTVSAELEAGEYVFYCPVGEHRANGMEGTLTVE